MSGRTEGGAKDRDACLRTPCVMAGQPMTHDLHHRHRRSRRRRQRHAGPAAGRPLPAEPARHRPHLSRGGLCAASSTRCRSTMSRRPKPRPARSIWQSSTGRCCRRMRSARRPRRSRCIPTVRRILVEKQRDFAKTPPGAVLDGRDIGTVVCPDADIKLYVTASAEVRAQAAAGRDREHRRHRQFRRNPRRYRAPRRARHGPRRLAVEAGRRRALA